MSREYIEARLVEAAHVEARLRGSNVFPAGFKTAWPRFEHAFEDRVHWPAERHADDAEARLKTASMSRGEVTRAEEVERWLNEVVTRDEDRRAIAAWAMLTADISLKYWRNGELKGCRRFGDWCQNVEHIARQTGYRRVSRAISTIEKVVGTKLYAQSAQNGVLQIGVREAYNEGTLDKLTPSHWMASDARPTDNPDTRDMSWSAAQAKRAGERKRKLRETEEA